MHQFSLNAMHEGLHIQARLEIASTLQGLDSVYEMKQHISIDKDLITPSIALPNGYMDKDTISAIDAEVLNYYEVNKKYPKSWKILEFINNVSDQKKVFNKNVIAVSNNGVFLELGDESLGLYHIIKRHCIGGDSVEFPSNVATVERLINLCMAGVNQINYPCRGLEREWDGTLEITSNVKGLYKVNTIKIVIGDPKYDKYGELKGGRIITCFPMPNSKSNKSGRKN